MTTKAISFQIIIIAIQLGLIIRYLGHIDQHIQEANRANKAPQHTQSSTAQR